MFIRRIDFNTYDLFIGKGWDQWARVRKGRSSTFRLAGEHVPHGLLKFLNGVLSPSFPINYNQSLGETVKALEHIAATR